MAVSKKPYKRPYKPPYNRYRGRRKAITRGSVYGAAGYQLYKDVKMLKDIVNVEYKENLYTVSGANVNWTGTIVTLNNVAQGVVKNQRVGDSLKAQRFSFRGKLIFNSAGTMNICRVMLVWDKENSIATLADLLQFSGNVNTVHSMKLEQNKYDSQILFDRRYKLEYNNEQALVDFSIPINQHTTFQPGSTTITRGALKLIYLSDYDPVALNPPSLNGLGSFTYTDN